MPYNLGMHKGMERNVEKNHLGFSVCQEQLKQMLIVLALNPCTTHIKKKK